MENIKEPRTLRLWEGAAPGARGSGDEDVPAISHYPAWIERRAAPSAGGDGTNDSGGNAAVIVVPGGGYGFRAPHEAEPVAAWLNSIGIDAFLLRYRVAPYRYPYVSMDGVRAVRMIRHRADELGIDGGRIGILGFSAGGHLAATVSTTWDRIPVEHEDAVDGTDGRPDLSVLCYPVISLASETHEGSVNNLLGPNATDDRRRALSADLNVSSRTPPAFLFHSADDDAVPVSNSLRYAQACWNAEVHCELHIFETGPHGVGLVTGKPELAGSALTSWPSLCEWFLRAHQFGA